MFKMAGEKILIVDDDEGIREMLADLMEVLGYRSVVAGNGKEGLARLEKEKVSLVISDIKMPVMDGIEMMKKIKENFSDLEVLLITGYEADYSREEVKEAGAADYIYKPFNIDVIEKKIKSLLEKRDGRGAHIG
jgi:CheY-like chemotaxis protein